MADIAASNVTYSALKVKKLEDGRKIVDATISFGNGVLTYPSGGIPITKAKLDCPVVIDALCYVDSSNADTQIFKYDLTNNKVRIYKETAGTYAELTGAVPATTVKVLVIGY